jgi:hypothetical protein
LQTLVQRRAKKGRHMNEEIIRRLLQLSPIWMALAVGFVPALIAGFQRRPMIRWYLYGFVCALVAWPLVALPTIHALLVRPRGMHAQITQRQRRADALALLSESSVRSYPSWIAELRRKSPAGIDRRRYAYQHIGPGEALEFVRELANRSNDHAVAYYHRGVHLGYVPKRHRCVAQALDDGLRLAVIAEKLKTGWIFRRRANFVGTRIVVLYDGR